MERQPRTPRAAILRNLRLAEKRIRLVKQAVMHVPAECVPPWLYEHQLQAAVRLLHGARREMGKDVGARLFAKSPSPDPSAKTLPSAATGLRAGREGIMATDPITREAIFGHKARWGASWHQPSPCRGRPGFGRRYGHGHRRIPHVSGRSGKGSLPPVRGC